MHVARSLSRETWAALGVLVAAVLVRLPTLTQPLLEAHAFRQTQTAYTAVLFAEQGIDLLHAKLPVLGPPYEVPFEFPLFQAIAAIVIDFGVPADTAVRLTGLGTFLLGAWILFVLARRIFGGGAALLALLAYTTSPLSVLFGRSSLIDHLAVGAALAGCYGLVRWIDSRTSRWLAFAVAAGIVAALVKLPSMVFWPLLALGLIADRRPERWRRDLLVVGSVAAVSLAAGTAWTAYADAIKSAAPFTSAETSGSLIGWNFGSLEQRLTPSNWASIGEITMVLTVGVGWWLPLLLAWSAAWRLRIMWTVASLLGVAVLLPLVFFNLYLAHSYYSIAAAPAWALLAGLGASVIVRRLRWWAAVLGIAAIAITLGPTAYYWDAAYKGDEYDPYGYLDQAAELARNSASDEPVVVLGEHWLPAPLYYARRWGLGVPNGTTIERLRASAPMYKALSVRVASSVDLAALRAWPWVAPVGVHTYRLGQAPADLPAGTAMWTPSPTTVELGRMIRPAKSLACSGVDQLVNRTGGYLAYVVDDSSKPAARLWLGSGLAAVPAGGAILFPPGMTDVAVRCSGADHLDVLGVFEASLPVP